MSDQMFERLVPLFKDSGLEKLASSTVLVFGCGGVGSFAIEALARSGVGHLMIVDKDRVEVSNLNRQLPALRSTLGQYKVEVMKARILDINPACKVTTFPMFYTFETKALVWENTIDFVFDAIDTVTYKIDIIKECKAREIPFITSCGQGNRMFPEKVIIKDLSKTAYDPIAKAMRLKLRGLGLEKGVPCVFSEEIPLKTQVRQPSSNALVPRTAGLVGAGYIIRSLLEAK